MLLAYNKPHLSFEEQIKQLEDRGMIIKDKKRALKVLETTGYYRMSGYWYPYRQEAISPNARSDFFKAGVSFDALEKLMLFDSQLREHLFGLIAGIEIAMRCRIAYIVGKNDRFGHMKTTSFEPKYVTPDGDYEAWKTKLNKQLKNSREPFIDHYKQKYQPPFPIWVSCELWDFGMTSIFYKMLRRETRDAIASSLGLKESSLLQNWLHALNVIRNICAHNARLWNRGLIVGLKLPATEKGGELAFLQREHYCPSKIAAAIFVIVWLCRKIDPRSKRHELLYLHLSDLETVHLPGLDYSVMGFEKGWENQPLWF